MPLNKEIIDRTLATKEGQAALLIVEILTDKGYDAWWVGGGVRDMLRGEIPKDIDVATDALPTDVQKLFPKNNDIGARFGNIIVAKGGEEIEITTFRKDDTASDGRFPESVVFGKRGDDADRRDFTINAIYWQPITGELYDPYNGEKDLDEKLIRFIGDPVIRIKHDALRMLRAVRFRALLDGQYHPDTYKALKELAALAKDLSGSRHFQELEKMLLGPHPDRGFEDLWETGILPHVIPELYDCKGIAQPADYHHEGDVWNHTMQCASSFTHDHGADVRWAALLHDVGKKDTFALKERIRFDHHATVSSEHALKILTRLQCEAKRKEKIAWLTKHHMMMGALTELNNERKAHWYYHPWFVELLQLFWLDIAGTTPADFSLYEAIVDDYNKFLDSRPRPPKQLLTGEEVMEILGIQPGAKVGEAMKALHDAQVRKEVSSKKEAKEFLRKNMEGNQ